MYFLVYFIFYVNIIEKKKRASRDLSRFALASVKIVRAGLYNKGKPSNLRLHNHTVHVNVYSEEQACVTYLLHKIRDEMVEEDLVLVGSPRLVITTKTAREVNFLLHFLPSAGG